MSYILGLNIFHADSSACILKNGNIIAAAEEERFNRIKHFAGIPLESIKYCLDTCSIKLDQIDFIAINQKQKSKIPNLQGPPDAIRCPENLHWNLTISTYSYFLSFSTHSCFLPPGTMRYLGK